MNAKSINTKVVKPKLRGENSIYVKSVDRWSNSKDGGGSRSSPLGLVGLISARRTRNSGLVA